MRDALERIDEFELILLEPVEGGERSLCVLQSLDLAQKRGARLAQELVTGFAAELRVDTRNGSHQGVHGPFVIRVSLTERANLFQ